MHSLKKLALIFITSVGFTNAHAVKEDTEKQNMKFAAGLGLVGTGAYNWVLFDHLVAKNPGNYRTLLRPEYKPVFPGSRILGISSSTSKLFAGSCALALISKKELSKNDSDPACLSIASGMMGTMCAANLAAMGRQLRHVVPTGKEIFTLRLKTNGLGVIGWGLLASYYDSKEAKRNHQKQ